MTRKKASVDVAINAYGKPYQTAITLFTLLKHSGEWIDKIYFIEEKKQPEPPNYQFILDELGDKVVYYRPNFWFWVNKVYGFFQYFRQYRYSVRYQYAWEKTDKDYLLVLHNDVYFTGDLVGQYLDQINGHTAIGKIGQCWNCPAHTAKLCDGDTYTKYKPDYEELMKLSAEFPGSRSHLYESVMEKDKPWPLPECRVNEYVAMINIAKARPATVPVGKAAPFGTLNKLDIGVEWFSQLNNVGHTFANFNYDPFAIHSWISLKNAGHDAMFNQDLYQYEESVARKVLEDEFGIVAP
ncbi:hypothetical protein DSL64_14100 [Dyadobacter luteus]|uniref:Glycosyl transferase n=1 Tax=Dyadobacter luteus TaxID=2259619 RepID=A0A3D8YAA4_9BACT|nr:hypothetical protein [Dyadobacter luteus]REA60666.1 hypothetical protein DSL64_14100 [Dyadobacter luteus]